jgi:site-specific DNA recombinase
VWHVDRLFGQPRDLERLIGLADHGFRVISSHGSRDLSDLDDRYILRIEVAHAARSSDDSRGGSGGAISATARRAARWVGRPGFGFARRDRSQPQPTDGPAGHPEPEGTDRARPLVPAEQVAAEQRALRER